MISVVMPVRNGAAFVAEAVRSVIDQAGEVIVVDDASTDDTPAVLRNLGVRVLRNATRLGIAGSLNRGIAAANGDFIARMDADDIALPHRLRTQREFLERHPEIALCGTWVRMFGDGWTRDRELECDPERIRCSLLLFNVLSHPTAMWRRDAFEQHGLAYDESFVNSEDYDLWCRASHCVGIANVPEVLLLYRVHDAQAGNDRAVRVAEGARVRQAQLARLGAALSEDELAVHEAIGWKQRVASTGTWMQSLLDANARSAIYDQRVLKDVLWSAAALPPL